MVGVSVAVGATDGTGVLVGGSVGVAVGESTAVSVGRGTAVAVTSTVAADGVAVAMIERVGTAVGTAVGVAQAVTPPKLHIQRNKQILFRFISYSFGGQNYLIQ